jgi:Flp pilus assembly protein CpaB
VSRRARALGFLLAAIVCAVLAASVASGYRNRVEAQYGPLRSVVVSTAQLPPGQPIGAEQAAAFLTVRRVPARFIPSGALTRPGDAIGRAPGARIPAGSYLLDAQLVVPQAEPPRPPGVGEGRRPLQVSVVGAEALLVGGASPEGRRVDVVVSRQSALGASARAHIAAEAVKLLALEGPTGPGDGWSATLAVTEEQALALIGAQSGGREIRLLPRT